MSPRAATALALTAKNALARVQSAKLIAPSQPSQAFDIHLTHLGPEGILGINFEFEMFGWRATLRCGGSNRFGPNVRGSTPRAPRGSRLDIVSTDRDSNLLSIINWRGPVGIGGEPSLHEASAGRAGLLAA
jgi:hypothetical protein